MERRERPAPFETEETIRLFERINHERKMLQFQLADDVGSYVEPHLRDIIAVLSRRYADKWTTLVLDAAKIDPALWNEYYEREVAESESDWVTAEAEERTDQWLTDD